MVKLPNHIPSEQAPLLYCWCMQLPRLRRQFSVSKEILDLLVMLAVAINYSGAGEVEGVKVANETCPLYAGLDQELGNISTGVVA